VPTGAPVTELQAVKVTCDGTMCARLDQAGHFVMLINDERKVEQRRQNGGLRYQKNLSM
jgi:hypothetical protein